MVGKEPPMPNIPQEQAYIVHLWQKMGRYMHGAMGIIPLNFQEINAYLQATQTYLSEDEVILIRDMSNSYVSYLQNENPTISAPFSK